MRGWKTTKRVGGRHTTPRLHHHYDASFAGGYHPVKVGERFHNGKYVVLRKLGWGHFSTVWLVEDTTTGQLGALKVCCLPIVVTVTATCPHLNTQVQKSAPQYTEAAQDEIQLLTEIRDKDPESNSHCVRLLDSFTHVGPHGKHVCMVFEVLGDNLLSLIKHYNYRGIPMPFVQKLTRQVLQGLDYLHTTCNIIHTGELGIVLTHELALSQSPSQTSSPKT